MNTMKKTIITLCLLATAMFVNAQSPVTFGVKGGVNLSDLTEYGQDKTKVGFNLGLTIDYEFAPNLYIMSGLELTTKGNKFNQEYLPYPYYGGYDDIVSGGRVKGSINSTYLQVPIHLGYKVQIAPSTKLVFSAGPYLAYGIGGKMKIDEHGLAPEYVGKHDLFGKNAGRRFDVGVGGSVGVEFGKMTVTLGYDHGLQNIWKGSGIKNKNAFLSVGYKF